MSEQETKVAPVRPAYCTDKHLRYLDALRESGITNMFGAGAYVKKAFRKLSMEQANDIVGYWMKTFSDRHD